MFARPPSSVFTLFQFEHFAVDTPDPYVELSIPNTPYQSLRTATVSNTKNPEWHEKFKFILDPEITNILRKY